MLSERSGLETAKSQEFKPEDVNLNIRSLHDADFAFEFDHPNPNVCVAYNGAIMDYITRWGNPTEKERKHRLEMLSHSNLVNRSSSEAGYHVIKVPWLSADDVPEFTELLPEIHRKALEIYQSFSE